MRRALLLGAAAVVAIGWAGLSASPDVASTDTGSSFACTVASITDGDTFRCEEEGEDGKQVRVRLSGIAARERDGSCSRGHPCPDAPAEAATAEMERLALGERLICEADGKTYGRIAAFCRRADGLDLSCAMVESGTALVWERYWRDHSCD